MFTFILIRTNRIQLMKITKEAALKYHSEGKPGKIEVIPTKPYRTQTDLSLAYSPGVAEPCLAIQENPLDAYKYTAKGNLVAVISNGTAVLGLGNIGALSGKPVMEGKGLLFKIYAGIDVFDIELDETNPEKFIEAVKAIAPTFGGINLEDIKAPECFIIEDRLKKELDIPVMHDDQHGTAIISSAGLLNALLVANKKIDEVKIVVNGAGASAISCTKLYMTLGAKKENIIMLDSKGVIHSGRTDLNEQKAFFVNDATEARTLSDAMKGADVFLGLSKGNILSQDMVKSMADNPIVFALANPNPEITYDEAIAARKDVIMATGRSDYPNQINNVIGFPYIFRGALDTHATGINEEMKVAAVYAISELAKKPVPELVNRTYSVHNLKFGRDYFIPKPVDPRLIVDVSTAVAKAAMDSGVARKKIDNWDAYRDELLELMGYESKLTRKFYDTARQQIQRVVYAEGEHPKMLLAAVQAKSEGICKPILLGNKDEINKSARELEVSLDGIEIISHRNVTVEPQRAKYAKLFATKRARNGVTLDEALDKMYNRNYFGMMMVEHGDADALITGIYSKGTECFNVAKEVIGIKEGYNHFCTIHIINSKRGPLFIADTLINRHPVTETLIDIAKITAETVKLFNYDPVMAMISYSNFGADDQGSPALVHSAVNYLHKNCPDMVIDGEMQINFALDKEDRDEKYPFNKLNGKDVNTLIFPNLSSANSSYQFLKAMMSDAEIIGPIQMGLNKSVHFIDHESSVRDIVNTTAVAAIDAQIKNKAK